jgi:hypothetical protein
MDFPMSVFLGGLFGASILGLTDSESQFPRPRAHTFQAIIFEETSPKGKVTLKKI